MPADCNMAVEVVPCLSERDVRFSDSIVMGRTLADVGALHTAEHPHIWHFVMPGLPYTLSPVVCYAVQTQSHGSFRVGCTAPHGA